jgi:hypothetical protein
MLYTTFPQPQTTIPQRAEIHAINATARNPFSGEWQRVQILAARTVYDVDPAKTYTVFDVVAPGASLPYSVTRDQIKNVSAFVLCLDPER